ncbi:MAG: HsmA family protein [Actinomycetota bacterium]|nr:HsmA family protein [Actinomycetota bacterium]
MPAYLIVATVLITLALVFYTVGVWSERIQRYLKSWHLAAFWLGLVFDAAGTYAMELLLPGWRWDFHTLTGLAAFLLMFAHAVWASWVVRRGTEEVRGGFHRYSMVVWLVWLVPYLGGMFAGMSAGR